MSRQLDWSKASWRGSRIGLPLRPRAEAVVRGSDRQIIIAQIEHNKLQASIQRRKENPEIAVFASARSSAAFRAKRHPITLATLKFMEKCDD